LESRLDEPSARSHESRPVRYKAKTATVSPPWHRDEFEKQDACFLGISLENSSFTAPKVAAMAQWMSRRFSQCTVLIGDSIHRITLETTRALSGPAAVSEALRLGQEFLETRRHVFEEYRPAIEFHFLTCAEVQSWPDYARYHAALLDLFATDARFRHSVEEFGRAYHGKRGEGVTEAERERRVGRSAQYFLEEFAIFACLKRRGLGVMVYPGSFSTLAEVARGLHPGVPPELAEMTVVTLQLKGRPA
jgi:tRNA-dependent cyclodipeptide synthase